MAVHEHLFDVHEAKRRLEAASGGYEVGHESPGLEVGVYVLVAPEPDRQQPHEDDEVYIVLEGRGTLQVEEEEVDLTGQAMFVAAHAEHRFTGYESLSLLVIFNPRQTRSLLGASRRRLSGRVTDRLRECRDFYCRWFGFDIGFRGRLVRLAAQRRRSPVALAFMHSAHPSSPPSPGPYSGDGSFITLQVADARAEHQRLLSGGSSSPSS